ncbi:glycine/betaine ABC transporter substrate-binding protein [Chromohalobacter japonicus]|uniref:Glycine/betaine ABC transporter substrate-binding protein n=3 Tax=Halomonadaceae TaxID=28256 RepID=A0A1Q8TA70_9GAMM|nr:glycine betaine ABC transporter substrate-binding protein [Chromohalobacter moromii]MCK2044567.1 glycine betaine ABC transporter substrate-binding protein [Chromohalobacter moromii]MCT8504279.1 glycine betaine ABC transporter substrate-binding protein [Chromohalobacter moromii]OLO10518.1 glycine/betaine ABC transporter substrate-binding protein [Chromohalobacter japonicus]
MRFTQLSTLLTATLMTAGVQAADQPPLTADGVENATITFGMPAWTSTEAPTAIAEQILEEAGYNVEKTLLAQPAIFQGMQAKQIDFFMDAWLPYTEQALWREYQDDLQKVATSYENVPLGWVVPAYVEEETIGDLEGKADKFDGQIVTIGAGAGIVDLSEQVMADEDYDLDGYQLAYTSEAAMMGVIRDKMPNEEPFIITGWRPHSMFSQYDLKFLEDTEGHFKYDNVYVLSYQGIEDKYPRAYDIMSRWSINVDDLEAMMAAYENDNVSFEDSAAAWIKDNRKHVDEMLGY